MQNLYAKKIKELGSHVSLSGVWAPCKNVQLFFKHSPCIRTPFKQQTERVKVIKVISVTRSVSWLQGLQCLLVLLHDSQWPQTDCFCQGHQNSATVRAPRSNKEKKKAEECDITNKILTSEWNHRIELYSRKTCRQRRMKSAEKPTGELHLRARRASLEVGLLSIIIWEAIWNKTFKPQPNPLKTAYPLINWLFN